MLYVMAELIFVMAELIFQDRVKEIKSMTARSNEPSVIVFDDTTFNLCETRRTSHEMIIRHADSAPIIALADQAGESKP
mgnify:FL=1